MAKTEVKGAGTKQTPWVLKTPPEHNPRNNRMRAS